jgi:hypothetical protein
MYLIDFIRLLSVIKQSVLYFYSLKLDFLDNPFSITPKTKILSIKKIKYGELYY